MFLEDMLGLIDGTCVRSAADSNQQGIVRTDSTGNKYVQWSDGSRTAAFGILKEIDECIASSLRLDQVQAAKYIVTRTARSTF